MANMFKPFKEAFMLFLVSLDLSSIIQHSLSSHLTVCQSWKALAETIAWPARRQGEMDSTFETFVTLCLQWICSFVSVHLSSTSFSNSLEVAEAHFTVICAVARCPGGSACLQAHHSPKRLDAYRESRTFSVGHFYPPLNSTCECWTFASS